MPRKRGKSGLPPAIPGEPFSLIGTLRRCTKLLTVADVAEMTTLDEKTVYEQINAGKIPEAFIGSCAAKRVDPRAWLYVIEHDNAHLLPSVKAADKARLKVAA